MTEKVPTTPNQVLVGAGLTFAFVIGLLTLLAFGLVKANNGPRDSGMAPDFTITGFDSHKTTLSKLRGKVS